MKVYRKIEIVKLLHACIKNTQNFLRLLKSFPWCVLILVIMKWASGSFRPKFGFISGIAFAIYCAHLPLTFGVFFTLVTTTLVYCCYKVIKGHYYLLNRCCCHYLLTSWPETNFVCSAPICLSVNIYSL